MVTPPPCPECGGEPFTTAEWWTSPRGVCVWLACPCGHRWTAAPPVQVTHRTVITREDHA